MNAVIEDTKYLTTIKFMNAVRKAGVHLNTKTGIQYRSAVSIRTQCTVNENIAWDNSDAVLFSFYNLTLLDAQKLNAAGFEVRFVEIRNYLRDSGKEVVAFYSKRAN